MGLSAPTCGQIGGRGSGNVRSAAGARDGAGRTGQHRRERQLEGIAKAKAAGVYKGCPSMDAAQVRAMKAQGLGASEIAKALRVGRTSVYRVLEAA